MAQIRDVSPWRVIPTESPRKPTPTPVASNGVIQFTVYHRPMGAPRMTQRDKWKKRPCVEAYHAFRDAIRRDFPGEIPPAEKIADLSWIAYFATNNQAMIGTLYRKKPDRDNVDKAILDALFEHDEAIPGGFIQRLWGVEDRLTIKITLLQ